MVVVCAQIMVARSLSEDWAWLRNVVIHETGVDSRVSQLSGVRSPLQASRTLELKDTGDVEERKGKAMRRQAGKSLQFG